MSSEQTVGWQASIGTESPQAAAPVLNVPIKDDATAPAANSTKSEWANKTVLLVDSNFQTRESRAKIMRTMGVRVESVPNADAARARLASDTYNLILVDLGRDIDGAKSLVNGIRTRNARQLVGFLVGRPLFVAKNLAGGSPRRRSSAAPKPPATEKSSPPTLDFGQKVRDAEAAQLEAAQGDESSGGEHDAGSRT